ncbi:hypothetical protein CKAN_02108100 [Cinnamomum micranthum f. kanehirae]|uniref:Uncharacterized protein n=1 Tax=Cinnamomum micranthum f. kanehirae TaxID=337451 RepID=A0A443PMA5_9MAGN|nr:hypothetical protein CKAN_02108100 [Cinnamomum micranthum f. kanehirae]
MALRAVRMNQGVDIEANGEGNDDQLLYQMESRLTRNRSLSIPRQGVLQALKTYSQLPYKDIPYSNITSQHLKEIPLQLVKSTGSSSGIAQQNLPIPKSLSLPTFLSF